MAKGKFDFSGYATKNDITCSDGRVIRKDAFSDNDGVTVPLVWQHIHDDPNNVLGHALLENRADGVYAYCSFNDSEAGKNTKILVAHGDIQALSIYAKELKQQGTSVLHGAIKEVSLVLAGANPGALIDNLNIAHGDSYETIIEEAIIYSGEEISTEEIEHSAIDDSEETIQDVFNTFTEKQSTIVYAMINDALEGGTAAHSDLPAVDDSGETVQDIFDTLTEKQQNVVYAMLADALDGANVQHSDDYSISSNDPMMSDGESTISDGEAMVVQGSSMMIEGNAMTVEGQVMLDGKDMMLKGNAMMIEGNAIISQGTDVAKGNAMVIEGNAMMIKAKDMMSSAQHSDIKDPIKNTDGDKIAHSIEGGTIMKTNVFDKTATGANDNKVTLTHSDMEIILKDARKTGSLKESFLAHTGITYGVENIDFLFPDARMVNGEPEVIKRDDAWVAGVLSATNHTPFSRIKSTAVDITADEARARGYLKGGLKKDEVIKLLRRITTPTTIYKKQKLDRDDIVDITDLDVVVWLKAEMRVMLNEEIARAVLIGDGRSEADADKINDDNIRPIYLDDNLYAPHVDVDANPAEMVDDILRARKQYKGSGNPTLYISQDNLIEMLLVRDTTGRKVYSNIQELCLALGVSAIEEVPVMEGVHRMGTEATPKQHDLIGIITNLKDYTIGADKGGAINMFDDFDIDYNQQKYLIETRCSGALTKPYSAIVIEKLHV